MDSSATIYTFPPCTFDYLPSNKKDYIRDAYEVISRNEFWGVFRSALLSRGVDSSTGFMFSSDPLYTKIMEAIVSTKIGSGHSGCSIAFVMRDMELIALNGELAYRELCLKNANKPLNRL
jgi:hypothetical protein